LAWTEEFRQDQSILFPHALENHLNKASWVFQLNGDSRGIPRVLAEGIETRIFAGEQVMISVVRIDPGASGITHGHPEEQWGVVLEGSCTRSQDGEAVECVVGDFWYTPAGVMHGIRAGTAGALVLDIFSPPRSEYKQAGRGFGAAKVEG
jgi:quercetin dioxygenase-like cupin family protein